MLRARIQHQEPSPASASRAASAGVRTPRRRRVDGPTRLRARGALMLAFTGWARPEAMSTREKLRSVRLSLRFIAPLAVTLALLAYALVPLVDRLTLRWWVSDLDTRSQLIANTLQDQLPDLVDQGSAAKINSLFMRAIQDERLYALAYCDNAGRLRYQTPTYPASLGC